MIPIYPQSVEIHLGLRDILHPMFQKLPDGISEFTFANLYLFQKAHQYRVSRLKKNLKNNADMIIITGCDRLITPKADMSEIEQASTEKFFMLPFGIPEKKILDRLFLEHSTLKCASNSQVAILSNNQNTSSDSQIKISSDMGYNIFEDRDNFDYLYQREHLADLPGRNYHKKRNLIKAFVNNHNYEGRPLLEEYIPDALQILDKWRMSRNENGNDDGDYHAAKEALEKSEQLELCGGIYYVEGDPVAYSLGEELACGKSFVIHFEKAVSGYKGLWQFVNQAFASIVTEHYETINREQDLGDEGLRHAKLSYHPTDFVRKYKIKKSDIAFPNLTKNKIQQNPFIQRFCAIFIFRNQTGNAI